MPSSILYSRGNNAPSASDTGYTIVANTNINTSATETARQITENFVNTYSRNSILITANAATTNGTFRLRVNVADVNQVATITALTTGEYDDPSGTDTISSGDEVAYKLITGATSTITRRVQSIVCTSSAAVTSHSSAGGVNFTTDSQSSPIGFMAISDANGTTVNYTDVNIPVASTLCKLFGNVSGNTRTTNTTIVSLINDSTTGNVTITYGNVESGIKEDTSNSDTLVAGDLVTSRLTTSTGGGTITFVIVDWHLTTAGSTFTQMTNSNSTSNSTGVTVSAATAYEAFGAGTAFTSATESDYRCDIKIACDVSKFWRFIQANSVSVTTTITVRKNGADTASVISVTTTATGEKEDTTDTVSFADTDEIDMATVAGGTGTITIRGGSLLFTTTGGGGGSSSVPVFMNIYRQQRG